MVGLLLWVRMVGFTSLFVSVPVGYLVYRKRPFRWLGSYLILLSVQAFFDLTYTFVVFSGFFAPENMEPPHRLFWILQALVSVLLLYVVPRFVQRLLGTADNRGARLWSIVPVGVLLAGYVFVILPIRFDYDTLASVAFYCYIAGWFGYGYLRRSRLEIGGWGRWIRLFLLVGSLWHFGAAAELLVGPVILSRNPTLPLILLSSSLFNLFWALIVIVPGIRMLTVDPAQESASTVPPEFAKEYGLSPREREVLEQLCRGLSNRDIAEELCVSPRTVENHIYNLYRKCGVRRRLELCNLTNRYR